MPVDVLPAVKKLRHLDAHVFLVGCILGNRFKGELGLIPVNKTQLAEYCNTSRNRLRESLTRLENLGLIELQSSGWLFMSHYMEGGTSSTSGTSGTTMAPQVPFDGTLGTTKSSVVVENKEEAVPLYVYTNLSANGGSQAQLMPRVFWDNETQTVEIDKDWLRGELIEWARETKAHLGEDGYERVKDRLRLRLLQDTRLRACLKKRDGKPSSPSQFKRLESLTITVFKDAMRYMAERSKNGRPSKVSESLAAIDRWEARERADENDDQ